MWKNKISSTKFSILASFIFEVLLILSSIDVTASNTFHIVTSLDSPCPGEFVGVPCLTLQQYVFNPSINDNTTLLFESGNHTLSSPFTATAAMKYNLSGSDVEVECFSAAKFTFVAIQQVYISGIRFLRCHRGINFTNILTLTISNCILQYGSSQVSRTRKPPIIISNVAACYIQRSLFSYNTNAYNTGYGTLYILNSALHIYNSTFDNNFAEYQGGVIYAESNFGQLLHVLIFNSNFTNNRAGNTAGLGGVIFIGSRNNYRPLISLIVSNCSFINNTAQHDGGALSYFGSEAVVITNSNFSNNSITRSDSRGGAIYSISMINATQCHFNANTANEGGAIYSDSKLISEHSTFTNNVANNGGAIYVRNISSITSCDFFHNTALNFGGGIYSTGTNSSIFITSTFFINNTAISFGGGAVYSNSRYSNITLMSSIFSNNSASYCSVLDVDEFYHFNVSIRDSVFTLNTATDSVLGGGVACIRNASIELLRSTFKHNYAALHGGVFHIDESDILVDGSLFVNNSAAMDGGVFYTYVHASNYNIRRCLFSHNSAGADGGVIFIGRVNSQVKINESIFSFNDASDRGGVAAIIGSSIYMDRTNVLNNTAEFGGVISACNSEVTALENELYTTIDPVYSFCTLYDGDVLHFNRSAPIDVNDDIVTTTSKLEAPTSQSPEPSVIEPAMMTNLNSSFTSMKLINSLQFQSSSVSHLDIPAPSVTDSIQLDNIQLTGEMSSSTYSIAMPVSSNPDVTLDYSATLNQFSNILAKHSTEETILPTETIAAFATEMTEHVSLTYQMQNTSFAVLFLHTSQVSASLYSSTMLDKTSSILSKQSPDKTITADSLLSSTEMTEHISPTSTNTNQRMLMLSTLTSTLSFSTETLSNILPKPSSQENIFPTESVLTSIMEITEHVSLTYQMPQLSASSYFSTMLDKTSSILSNQSPDKTITTDSLLPYTEMTENISPTSTIPNTNQRMLMSSTLTSTLSFSTETLSNILLKPSSQENVFPTESLLTSITEITEGFAAAKPTITIQHTPLLTTVVINKSDIPDSTTTVDNREDATKSSFNPDTELKFTILFAVVSVLLVVIIFGIIFMFAKWLQSKN